MHQNLSTKNISDELYREYIFPCGSVVRLDQPSKLNVSARGGHRVVTSDGMSHYIPYTWIHLRWRVKDGAEPFAF